jgi:type IX secretion system PorP/SprF family membrane protein
VFLKRFLFFLLIQMSAYNCFAQEDLQYSHHYFLSPLYNPASVGSNTVLMAGADFRIQWLGITGQPLTQLLYANMPSKALHGGVGAIVLNDFSGAHRSTTFNLQYAYARKLAIGQFMAGAEAGLVQYNLAGSKLRAPDGLYQNGIDHNDAKLPTISTNAIAPDFGIGFKWLTDKINLAWSLKHLITMPLQFATDLGQNGTVKYNPTMYLNASYRYTLQPNLDLHPSILLKSDFKKTTMDLNVLGNYQQKYLTGLGIRGYSKNSFDAIALFFGYQWNDNFFLVYSYDLTVSKLIRASTGSHELSLHYKMSPPRPPIRGKIIYSPRFL